MEKSPSNDSAGLLCLRCSERNSERASRCSQCGAPLDDFTSTSPWEMGTAKSSAYSPAASPKTKPIIFWGAWMYFEPSAMIAIWYIGSFVLSFFGIGNLVIDDEPELMGGITIVLIAMFLYGALSIWVLWSVSKGYFQKR